MGGVKLLHKGRKAMPRCKVCGWENRTSIDHCPFCCRDCSWRADQKADLHKIKAVQKRELMIKHGLVRNLP